MDKSHTRDLNLTRGAFTHHQSAALVQCEAAPVMVFASHSLSQRRLSAASS